MITATLPMSLADSPLRTRLPAAIASRTGPRVSTNVAAAWSRKQPMFIQPAGRVTDGAFALSVGALRDAKR